MSHPQQKHAKVVFILWRNLFDENAAVTFVTTLRQRGLRVYMVGLSGLSATGQTGLIINADRTLGQVQDLAAQALCIIAPCDVEAFLLADNDLRVAEFITDGIVHHARIILSNREILTRSSLTHLEIDKEQFDFYGEVYDLPHFADQLATLLLADITSA